MNSMIKGLALTAAVVGSSAASAHQVLYHADLSGPAESPANASPGLGSADVTVDLDLATMRVAFTFAGLTGTTTASHIHCCTTVPGVSTAGVATPTPFFPGFTTGVTSGSYDQTFDLALASSYNGSFITNNGGAISTAMNALLLGLADGKAYLNIHTSTFTGGEIRGFLIAQPVPVPAAVWLLGSSLAGLAGLRRQRVA